MNKKNKLELITIFTNFLYFLFSAWISLGVLDFFYSMFSDFSRFKMTHSFIGVSSEVAVILAWLAFSFAVLKLNRRVVYKKKEVLVYSVIPAVVLIIVFIATKF